MVRGFDLGVWSGAWQLEEALSISTAQGRREGHQDFLQRVRSWAMRLRLQRLGNCGDP